MDQAKQAVPSRSSLYPTPDPSPSRPSQTEYKRPVVRRSFVPSSDEDSEEEPADNAGIDAHGIPLPTFAGTDVAENFLVMAKYAQELCALSVDVRGLALPNFQGDFLRDLARLASYHTALQSLMRKKVGQKGSGGTSNEDERGSDSSDDDDDDDDMPGGWPSVLQARCTVRMSCIAFVEHLTDLDLATCHKDGSQDVPNQA